MREKTKHTCYGSILRCPKKEYNKKIVIKSEDILFLLFREYLHRVSGIEIFTTNNKSNYFNFNKKFDLKKKIKEDFLYLISIIKITLIKIIIIIYKMKITMKKRFQKTAQLMMKMIILQ